jgi:metallophosphoesterase (TIGR00282 family)
MRVLFIGDIVGQPGVQMVVRAVPWLRDHERLDLVVANAENAAGGSGLTPALYRRLRQAGVDAITLGDHIYKKQEIIDTMAEDAPLCKPANFPAEAPGRELALVPSRDGTLVGVFTLLGRLYMRPVDCPFHAADRVLKQCEGRTRLILLDMHGEATGEKALMGRYLDGRVSAVIGTHTHVATADERILPGGTAFLTDAGMTGPYDSILGRRVDRVLHTTLTFVPTSFDVATGDPRLAGVVLELEPETGKAITIQRIMVTAQELAAQGS